MEGEPRYLVSPHYPYMPEDSVVHVIIIEFVGINAAALQKDCIEFCSSFICIGYHIAMYILLFTHYGSARSRISSTGVCCVPTLHNCNHTL